MPTRIEWADESWNPVTGCTKVSAGCKHCFAERMARRLAGRFGYPEAPHHFDVTLHPDRLEQPLRWKKPRRIFVNSMSDFFHSAIPVEFQSKMFSVMRRCPQHTFMILTKRANALEVFNHVCGWPDLPNVWLGVTVENQKCADERRTLFEATPAAVKYVSYEPALSPVDWTGWEFIDQLIFGGESGPGARPAHLQWFRDARDWCLANDIAPFFKQHGAWIHDSQVKKRWGYVLPWPVSDKNILQDGDDIFYRVGKKAAGCLLDGRTWDEYPRSSHHPVGDRTGGLDRMPEPSRTGGKR